MSAPTPSPGPIPIPSGPVPATRRNPQLSLFYGSPKVGKTHAIAALPDCLLLELEPGGADHFPARKVDVPDMATLNQVLDQLTAQRKAGTPAAKRIAIDTIDVVEEWCDPEALREYKASVLGRNFEGTSILELPQGAGYFRLREKMGEMLWAFTQAADEVILLAHVRDRLITKVTGEVMAQDIDLTGKIRNIVCARSSAVGFMRRDPQSQLLVNFKTTEAVNCGSRCEHLKGREIVVGRLVKGQPVFDWSQVFLPEPEPQAQPLSPATGPGPQPTPTPAPTPVGA